jgi:DNA-binding beta-propeller fold protein YncE
MKGINTGSHTLTGIAVNKDNSRIAVAYESSHCVHVFNTDGDLLLTYGSEGSGQGQLSAPEGLAFLDEKDLVIADCSNHRICIVNTTTGTLVKTFGNYGNGNREFCFPHGVHVDDDCNIIVSDCDNHRVQVFTKDGDYQYQFSLTNQDDFAPLNTVTHRGLFYVSDYDNHVIHVFEKKGNVPTRISTIGGVGSADGKLNRPWGLAIDNDHHLLVCDRGNNRIQKFTLDGRFVGKTCDKIKNPLYIEVLRGGELLINTTKSGAFFVK